MPDLYDTIIIGSGPAALTAAVFTARANLKTSLEGCYAAGACTGGNLQIAKSAGEGCNAAISIIKKVKGLANYSDLT